MWNQPYPYAPPPRTLDPIKVIFGILIAVAGLLMIVSFF